ncbi:MAG TPA: dihydrofolate reductase [Puia sp.]|nr:dihydrofolate reductase [Puia sp.]
MIISVIVAASENNVIGKNNQLLWRLPNDAKYFKNTTWGMPVIMGRKTFESLRAEPLPGRINIVVTRQKNWDPGKGNIAMASSVEDAVELAAKSDCRESFIIGGGQIYAESMTIADRIYMTRVHAVLEGDTFFPSIDPDRWILQSNRDLPADDKHAFPYSFQLWEKTKQSDSKRIK